MTDRSRPPFRADHVGSLLRPAELAEAREKAKQGEISAEECRAVEDACIREAVAMQEAVGLRAVGSTGGAGGPPRGSGISRGCHWQLVCQCSRHSLTPHWRASRQWHPGEADRPRAL